MGQSSIQLRRASPPGCGEGGLKLAAVFDGDDVPAHVAEQALDAAEEAVGDDGIEGLAVVVDDPPDVANVVFPALEQGFVDVAFVEFGVAGDGDVAAGGRSSRPRPWRRDVVRIRAEKVVMATPRPTEPVEKSTSGPSFTRRRIGLDAAEGAEAGHFVDGLAAEEVVDGVEDGSGVGFDGDAVLRAGRSGNRARP